MITRFAPSPTGPLHLGHAFSAILAHDMAKRAGGSFLLRIEDIDRARSRDHWEQQIYDDLAWLGLNWEHPVMRQSERKDAYEDALSTLAAKGLLYPCRCNRRDIIEAVNAPQEGAPAPVGPDGIIYPGTCRPDTGQQIDIETSLSLRLNLQRIDPDLTLTFRETGPDPDNPPKDVTFTVREAQETIGDPVLRRQAVDAAYHLAVVVDDAAQNITHVVRGEDLFEATRIHVILQHLLGLPTPTYLHHRLIRDDNGKRLAKRDDARAIAKYREDGLTPEDIRAMVFSLD